MDNNNEVEVVLKAEAGPQVNVAVGAVYYREFHRALQPFTVPREEYETLLAPTGLFEESA